MMMLLWFDIYMTIYTVPKNKWKGTQHSRGTEARLSPGLENAAQPWAVCLGPPPPREEALVTGASVSVHR